MAIGVAWAALGGVGWSQQANRPKVGPNVAAREELFKMVDAYVVSSLQESLGLSDDQFARLLPAIKRLQTVRRGFVQRRRETMAEMRRLLESGSGTGPRITELITALKVQELEQPAAVRREADAVDAQLTPLQQAKLRLLEARVEQRLRELLQRGQGQNARQSRPRGDLPSASDLDP